MTHYMYGQLLILLIDNFHALSNYDFAVEPIVIKPDTHLTLSPP